MGIISESLLECRDLPTCLSDTRLSCPLCNGMLIELRGAFRCSRCAYTFCAGCEGNEPEFAIEDR